jgi:hypothetical protein
LQTFWPAFKPADGVLACPCVTVNPLGLRSIGQATGTLQSPFGSGPTELSVSPVAGFGLSGSPPELSPSGRSASPVMERTFGRGCILRVRPTRAAKPSSSFQRRLPLRLKVLWIAAYPVWVQGMRESRRISPTSWMGRLSAGVIPPRTVAAEARTSNLSRSSLPHICRPGGGDACAACAACKPLSTTPQVTRRSPGQRLPWRIWVESLIRFRNHVRKVQMDHSLSTTLVILSTRLSASW